MAINFAYYPDSNRVPGVYVEMDPSQANTATVLQRTLLIGQMASTGLATPDEAFLVESVTQAQQMCGIGSMLAQMATRYLQRDTFGALYLLPLQDDAAGNPAHGSIAFSGTATAPGTLNCYIGGTLVQALVSTGMTGAQCATALANAINTNAALGVEATAASATVTVTSVGAGLVMNDIDIRFNYLGAAGGEYTPAGIVPTVTAMSGGTANPDITVALANLSSEPFDFIGLPYTDPANLAAMKSFLADDVGRWSWSQMIYGGAFSAFRGTLGTCTTFGLTQNDAHMTIMSFNDSPDTVWLWTTEVIAMCAISLRADPGLPLQSLGTTLKAPPIASRWTIGERNTLLYSGMSTFKVGDDGTVTIERMCNTYQKNAAGQPDNSYLDVETGYGLTYVARDLTAYLSNIYQRKKLVANQTQVTAGSNCVTANMVQASVVSEYRALEIGGYVQNSATFAKSVVVENAGNGLVKVLAPVDLVNQLRQIAILLQFRKS